MTPDDRLRADLESLERSAPTALPPRPPPPGRSPARRLWLPAFVTLAAGVLLGAYGAQWLEGLRPNGSAAPNATTTPGRTNSPTAGQLEWSIVPFPALGAVPVAIGTVDGRLIVTGSDADGPAAWTSDDEGATWARAEVSVVEPEHQDGVALSLGSVAAFGDRLVSIGRLSATTDFRTEDMLWISTDRGATWRDVKETPTTHGLNNVIATDTGFVAVGSSGGRGATALAWLSYDGTRWEGPFYLGGLDEVSFAFSVAERDETLVAAGMHQINDPALGVQAVPVAWISRDGRAWESVKLPQPGSFQEITATPEGFAAVGFGGLGAAYPVAWQSGDGRNWSTKRLDVHGGGAMKIAASASGFMAIGGIRFGEMTSDLNSASRVWWVTWDGDPAVQDVDARLVDLVAFGDSFVAIGDCGPAGDCMPMLAVGRPVGTGP